MFVAGFAIRIGVARGGGGECGGPHPLSIWAADALFLFGS